MGEGRGALALLPSNLDLEFGDDAHQLYGRIARSSRERGSGQPSFADFLTISNKSFTINRLQENVSFLTKGC